MQGAALAGAHQIVVVEPVEWKREKILEFGATHTAASQEEAFFLVQGITNGAMADKAILCVGTAKGEHVGQMMSMIKKCGRAVVTSVAPMLDDQVKMNLFEFAMQRKELVGCIFGNANPQVDIPRLLSLYKAGKLKLDEMITTEYTLDEINKGYQDMRDGKNFRGLIKY